MAVNIDNLLAGKGKYWAAPWVNTTTSSDCVCPVCGNEYCHLGAVKAYDGGDVPAYSVISNLHGYELTQLSWQATYFLLWGSYGGIIVEVVGECGHVWYMTLNDHKGYLSAEKYYDPNQKETRAYEEDDSVRKTALSKQISRDELMTMRERGMTNAEIAASIDCSVEMIRKYIGPMGTREERKPSGTPPAPYAPPMPQAQLPEPEQATMPAKGYKIKGTFEVETDGCVFTVNIGDTCTVGLLLESGNLSGQMPVDAIPDIISGLNYIKSFADAQRAHLAAPI